MSLYILYILKRLVCTQYLPLTKYNKILSNKQQNRIQDKTTTNKQQQQQQQQHKQTNNN